MAKEQPTAEESGGKQGTGGWGLIGGILLLVATPIVITLGLVFGLLGGSTTSGATAPQPINVATPSAEVKQLLQTFNIASDTTNFLRTDSTALTKYQTALVTLAEKLRNNDPAYAAITTNRPAILTLIDTMLGQIQTIQSQVGAGANDQTAKLANDFILNTHKLSVLAAPNAISALALQYAADNAASGYTKYTYSRDNREQFVQTQKGQSDCSSFVSGIMYQSGIISAPISYSTQTLYATAKAGKDGFHIVKESTDASGIANSDVTATLQPGDIILSGDDTYANGGGSVDNRHSVLYAGNDTVVESTNARGKNGIQTDTLDNRLKRQTQVIIRGDGV